jgi:hypothetical protein
VLLSYCDRSVLHMCIHYATVDNNFFINFIAQKVSNINLVTKDYKIVPLTNLLGLLLAGRVVGGVCLFKLILAQQ